MTFIRSAHFDAPPALVLLECPKCHRTKMVAKDATDPPATYKVCVQCPDCNSGDFDTAHYFDIKGNEL